MRNSVYVPTQRKTKFRQTCQELKEAGDLQVRDSQFDFANIAQEVIDGVQLILQPLDATKVSTSEVYSQ